MQMNVFSVTRVAGAREAPIRPPRLKNMQPEIENKNNFTFDVFLSYSRKDMAFVRLLEKALRNYRPPKDLDVPHRHLRVFRDESDLVGSDLTQALEDNLRRSAKLIVICSPASRLRQYVGLEIRKFAELRGASNIIALYYCDPRQAEDLQHVTPDMLLHEELAALYVSPLAEDYKCFDPKKHKIDRGAFHGQWFGMLARIYDKEKPEVEQRERKRQAESRNKWIGALTGIIVVLAALTIWAFKEKDNAIRQGEVALSRQLAAQALEASSRSLDLALLLNLQAVAMNDSSETQSALARNIHLRGPLKQFLSGHKNTVLSASFSPDGKQIATGSQDKSVILWNVKSGVQTSKFDYSGAVRSIAFSPEGKTIATGDESGDVVLKELATGIAYKLSGHRGKVLRVAYSPDGATLATAGADGRIFVWDTIEHKTRFSPIDINRPREASNEIRTVAYSPDGKLLGSGAEDGNLYFWDARTGKLRKQLFVHKGGVQGIAFSPDGKTIASSGDEGKIKIWDVDTNAESPSFRAHNGSEHNGKVYALAFVRNGELIASAGEDRKIILQDVKTGQEKFRLEGHEAVIWGLPASRDGSMLASTSFDRKVILWNVAVDSPRIVFGSHKGQVRDIAFRPDGKQIASGSWDGELITWDTAGGRAENPVQAHSGKEVYRVAYSPDGTWLATGGGDNKIVLWNARTRSSKPLSGHGKPVRSLAFSPDSKYLASGDRDGKIVLWNVATGELFAQPKGHDVDTAVYSLAFSPDGKTLASAGFDRKVMLRDPQSGEPQKHHSLHPEAVRAVTISPDGKTIASGSTDGSIILWDIATDIKKTLFHVNGVEGLAYAPDGKTLVSVGGDANVYLWNAETGTKRAQLKGHANTAYAVAFSPKNPFLIATASMDNNIRLWDIKSEDWLKNACETANRNLTCAEWFAFVGAAAPYKRNCSEKPFPSDWNESTKTCEPSTKTRRE